MVAPSYIQPEISTLRLRGIYVIPGNWGILCTDLLRFIFMFFLNQEKDKEDSRVKNSLQNEVLGN